MAKLSKKHLTVTYTLFNKAGVPSSSIFILAPVLLLDAWISMGFIHSYEKEIILVVGYIGNS